MIPLQTFVTFSFIWEQFHHLSLIVLTSLFLQATPNTLEPNTTAKSGLFSIVEPVKPDPISELLFTKVDSQSLDQAAQSSKPKKMLIEEIE